MNYGLFYRSKMQKDMVLTTPNISLEPNHLRQNAAYGVASNGEPYHFYECIPDVPREYEVPGVSSEDSTMEGLIQPSTLDSESRQVAHAGEGSSDYYVNDVQSNDGDSDYYVNDP